MFGHFLTWLAETTASVLVMATANDITKLPPELLRAGRFDATFFVDLPGFTERTEIIRIMNRKYHTDIPLEHASKLQGYTGAEIEQLAKDSLYDGLDPAFESLVPLYRTMREDIQTLRDWAKSRARRANTEDAKPADIRRIRTLPN
jgi:SpoVK/Ycf46/Vps4 family AAA+-type ATPase